MGGMRRTFATGTVAADACTYDAEGRVTSESEQVPGLTPVVTLSDQYTSSNRTQLAATIGTTADFVNNYQYTFYPTDNLYGQMSQVTQTSNGGDAVDDKRVDFTYDADGQSSTIDRYASLDTSQLVADSTYGYNAAGQITSLTDTAADGYTTYAAYTWTYNASGEVSSFSNNANVADYSAENVGTYSYDATRQLTGAAPPIGTDRNAANYLSNSYDSNGNTTTLNGVAAAVGADNTLANDGTWAYFYDADGNLIEKVGDAGGSAAGTQITYAYNNRNGLTAVTYYSGSPGNWIEKQQVTYVYDSFGNMVGRSVWVAGLGSHCGSQQFIYDGTNVVLEFSEFAAEVGTTDRYLWGPGTTQLLADEEQVDWTDPGGIQTVAGNTDWALGDNQNTVRDLVTDDGSLDDHIAYTPFGQQLLPMWNGAYTAEVVYAFGYTGAYTDVVTGDQLHGVRWYDPSTERRLTQDPSGLGAGHEPVPLLRGRPDGCDGCDGTAMPNYRWRCSGWGWGRALSRRLGHAFAQCRRNRRT